MFEWLTSQSGGLNVLINVGMLLVWLFYFQILFANFRDQKRPKILVNRGGGGGWDSRCLVTNMSEKSVYIYAAIVKVETGEDSWQTILTERRGIEEGRSAAESRERIGQGPLAHGEMIDLASYREMIALALGRDLAGEEAGEDAWREVDTVEVKVAAIYDSEDIIIGASRRFAVLEDGKLNPETIYTRQIRARRHRKVLADDLLQQIST